MKTAALCLLCIIVTANAMTMMEKYPGMFKFNQKRSIMNVMAQVESMIKNGGPLDAITRVLDEFDQEIRSEQLAHDQLYERQTAECEDEFEFRTSEINDAKAALQEGEETLSGCQTQRVRAVEDLATTKKQLKQKNAELINTHTSRKREKYAFDTAQGVYGILHPAVGEALEFLESLFAGEASFLQVARHTNKMLVQMSQIGQAHHMAPILAALAQVASQDVQADQELLNKLQSLFTNLRAKMEAENAAAIQAEEAAVAKYNADVARIEGIIANLEQQQEDLENEIADLDKCIITQQNIVASATQKIDRNQRLFDDAVKMCHAMDVQYASAKAGRAAELDLLHAIEAKVEEHFANIHGTAKQRGELDNFDDTYSNASAYEEKEFVPQ